MYRENASKADDILTDIAAWLTQRPGEVAWGDVGDMAHVKVLLQEIKDFITNAETGA